MRQEEIDAAKGGYDVDNAQPGAEMHRCPKCNSARVFYLSEKAGKCRECGHWWGETMCIAMDLNYAFDDLFGPHWQKQDKEARDIQHAIMWKNIERGGDW